MKGLSLAVSMFLWSLLFPVRPVFAADMRWHTPFDTQVSRAHLDSRDTVLTLTEVLALVADQNPAFQSWDFRNGAAQAQLQQAGLRPNPELGAEFEEVSWDAPGFSESEMTFSLSQEFELFGQRGARQKLARAGWDAVKLATKISAFDLYLDVKTRFFALVHAQRQCILADSSIGLAESVVHNIMYRMEKGAALQAELLLARLELQRVGLTHQEARQDLAAARIRLSALWGGDPLDVHAIADEEVELQLVLERLAALPGQADSSREMLHLQSEADIARAEQQLAGAEAKPNVTFVGGYKRLAADRSNSLLFGLSVPLPLFNRSQGAIAGLDAKLRALEFEEQRARTEVTAEIHAATIRLVQLTQRHAALDSLLLPTADEAYGELRLAYEAGRVPYTSLLEAERAVIELRFEHNDMLLAISDEIIALERITGAILFTAIDGES